MFDRKRLKETLFQTINKMNTSVANLIFLVFVICVLAYFMTRKPKEAAPEPQPVIEHHEPAPQIVDQVPEEVEIIE